MVSEVARLECRLVNVGAMWCQDQMPKVLRKSQRLLGMDRHESCLSQKRRRDMRIKYRPLLQGAS